MVRIKAEPMPLSAIPVTISVLSFGTSPERSWSPVLKPLLLPEWVPEKLPEKVPLWVASEPSPRAVRCAAAIPRLYVNVVPVENVIAPVFVKPTRVGPVPKTRGPVPVSSVTSARRFALLGVAVKVSKPAARAIKAQLVRSASSGCFPDSAEASGVLIAGRSAVALSVSAAKVVAPPPAPAGPTRRVIVRGVMTVRMTVRLLMLGAWLG